LKLQERLDLLAELGHYLQSDGDADLETAIRQSSIENQWFTEANVRSALKAIATQFLDRDKLAAWAAQYPMADPGYPEKTVAIIMAGNIPLVGFQDWLCVFVAGQQAKVKLSDKDKRLLPLLVKKMGEWRKDSWAYTEFLSEGDFLKNFDAVIATGSNNTARYFEYYFKDKPSIIRKSRNSVAVLNGQETTAQLIALGDDIFRYFGLGCRNVSKLFVPKGYDFTKFFEAIFEYQDVIHYEKYANNYDYNKAVFLMSNFKLLDNGFLTIKEDTSHASPISSVFYEFYDNLEEVENRLVADQDSIQCIVSSNLVKNSIPFGTTQKPALWDYADGIDTLNFLTRI